MKLSLILLLFMSGAAFGSEPTCADLELRVYDKCSSETGIDLGQCAYMVFDQLTVDVSKKTYWQLQACTEGVRRKIEVSNLRCD